MRKVMLMTAALVAAVAIFVLATLPPRPLDVSLAGTDPSLRARTLSGGYHIHTSRSDGAGDKASVAAAARQAGLGFAIFTDHGDATRAPDPPAYLDGVLCIDAVEISTNRGHYVALDMPAAPYPLGGEAAAVAEDVARLGGFGVAAHPDHPRSALAWTDWKVPIDGLEWLNADSEWRNETAFQLTRVFFDYLVRPGPAIASTFDRPDGTLQRWDALSKTRPVVALAAVDAHGGARLRDAEGGGALAAGPAYRASFESLSNRVVLERPLTGDAGADARLVFDAIRRGRVYSVVDAIGRGVLLNIDGAEPAPASSLPSGAHVVTTTDGERKRIEIRMQNAPGEPPVPWVLSNWSGPPAVASPPPVPSLPAESAPLAVTSEWRVEKDARSSGRVSGGGGVASLEFKLGAGERASQFVAAAADLRAGQSFDRLRFRGRANRPMRVSVQLRFTAGEMRWLTSVYLSQEDRDLDIPVDSLRPAEPASSTLPPVAGAHSILFVVDLVNARPGDAGSFTISDLRGVR